VDGAPNDISVPRRSLSKPHLKGSRRLRKSIENLTSVTRVGLDLAKRVFQVHAVDAMGEIVAARKLASRPARRLFLRASAVSGGDGGMLFGAPLGADADRTRARGEADRARASEALCSAQQERRGGRGGDLRGGGPTGPAFRRRALDRHEAALMRHRPRELLAGQRTEALNALRGHVAEIGVVAPQGA
jgi:transposase